MLAPFGSFLCVKNGEIALVTNLRPLMSEQLLKFGYILYCLNGVYVVANVESGLELSQLNSSPQV